MYITKQQTVLIPKSVRLYKVELVWYLQFLSHKSTRSIATIAGEPSFLSDHLNDMFTGILCKEKRCEEMYITQEQNAMELVRAGTVVHYTGH